MNELATKAALAALRYWAALADGIPTNGGAGVAVWDSSDQYEAVRQAAWLVQGAPATGDGWPACDLTQPLQSIFSRITPRERDRHAPDVYLRRASLALRAETLFPTDKLSAIVPNDADPLIELRAAVAELTQRALHAERELESLLYAFQRHAWCLPSPLAAVSLYDFARANAAVAAAQAINAGDLFLLGGDLSGVQSFLYTLTAAGATKQLRGRSFYLQLLTEACARYLLQAAGLPLTNLLYAGGGRFYALLPNRIAGVPADVWLDAQRQTLDAFFLHQHQGDMYLALGGATLRVDDLLDEERFRITWGAATEASTAAKRRRFADMGAELFAPQGHNGNEDWTCAICGYQNDPQDFAAREEGRSDRCKLCDSFEDLGRLLHNADYLLLHHLDRPAPQPNGQRQRWHELLNDLGMHVQFSSNGKHARPGVPDALRPFVRWTTALALKDDALPPPLAGPVVSGFRPVANTAPTMDKADMDDWEPDEDGEAQPNVGDVKPFSVMVAQSRGIKRLGVLRMDVDDLGDLFRFRLDSGLARVSALSAALALFFEGWVGQICDQVNAPSGDPEQRGSIYTIYSGGDDLFIVGSWHLLPGLARRISDDLATYAGRHPEVHVSAGISLHTRKFPLYQAAEAAGEQLQRAKKRPGKAALGWLDQVAAWEYAPSLFALMDELYGHVQEREQEPPRLSRAILQTLQQLYVQYTQDLAESRRKGKTDAFFYGPWVWRRMYQLTRVADQVNAKHTDVKAWVYGLRDGMLDGIDCPADTGGRAIERAGLAARWVQLLIRKEQD